MTPPLAVRRLGVVRYGEAEALQARLVTTRRSGDVPDTLLLLEHPPVITLGRGADPANVLLSAPERSRLGIELYETGRGGDVTYHGPGQLVGYPILALQGARRDAHRYLRDLEEALLDCVAEFGIAASRVAGLTGIWADGRKLAAIGVRISTGWITSHGFALNVSTELSGFGCIVPCGIRGRGVTSMTEVLGRQVDLDAVADRMAAHVAERFGLAPVDEALPRTGAVA